MNDAYSVIVHRSSFDQPVLCSLLFDGVIMPPTRVSTILCLLTIAATALLSGCAALAEIKLPRPSPVPTLARLPTVTPAPPTPTNPPPPPTATPVPPTPTNEPIQAVVRVGANVRGGPGLTFEIVGTVIEG